MISSFSHLLVYSPQGIRRLGELEVKWSDFVCVYRSFTPLTIHKNHLSEDFEDESFLITPDSTIRQDATPIWSYFS